MASLDQTLELEMNGVEPQEEQVSGANIDAAVTSDFEDALEPANDEEPLFNKRGWFWEGMVLGT